MLKNISKMTKIKSATIIKKKSIGKGGKTIPIAELHVHLIFCALYTKNFNFLSSLNYISNTVIYYSLIKHQYTVSFTYEYNIILYCRIELTIVQILMSPIFQ